MNALYVIVALLLVGLASSVRILKQYEGARWSGAMTARRLTALTVTLAAGSLAATALPASAAPPAGSLGAHVSECAHIALGKRPNPPQVTCVHDGHMHTFANFGELVAHVRDHHGH